MDDIQFWLYLLFAIIYFISRSLKKKGAPKPPERPQASNPQQSGRRKPVTFDELLREFTEGREEEQEVVRELEEKPREIHVEEKIRRPAFEEGVSRTFSDEESRRVYEESIRRAEGATLELKHDEDFRSGLKSRYQEEQQESGLAAEIKAMLRDPEDIRKAVILSEILNRKY